MNYATHGTGLEVGVLSDELKAIMVANSASVDVMLKSQCDYPSAVVTVLPRQRFVDVGANEVLGDAFEERMPVGRCDEVP